MEERKRASRMEKDGGLEEQTDSCGKRGTEMEDRWSNDSVYLLPLRERERGGERWRRHGDEKKRSEEDDPGTHLLLVHNRWEGETTSKKTRPRIEGKTGTSTCVEWSKKGQGE